jgi:N-acetylmuramoyl-L-alanine amidase CwlA
MRKVLSKEQWAKKRRRKMMTLRITVIVLFLAILIFTFYIVSEMTSFQFFSNNVDIESINPVLSNGRGIETEYLSFNEYSRPGTTLKRIKGIVIHYTANPGSTADANRNYFQGLAEKHTTYASSHYIVGIEGEIVQCIPLNEIAYASNDRNNDTIAIECCHPDETGQFSESTYDSLVSLVSALCIEFDLGVKDVIRHYDVTGKLCPLYYVENEVAWEQLRNDVQLEILKIKKQIKNKT